MPRKQVTRRLPPLPKSRTLQAKEHKTERLIEILGRLAYRAQEDQPHAFYSMREVSDSFRVPVSLVSRAYERLEDDGLLRRIRGSQTVLRGLKYDRKLTVRGFVGLPVATSKLVTMQDNRTFLMSLHRQLRLNGFAAAPLEIVRHEADEFAERVKKYEIDTIVWFQPGCLAKQVSLRLSDLGLRVIGVSDGIKPSLFCRYELRRENAVRNIAHSWRSDGIKSVIVISTRGRRPIVDGQKLAEILDVQNISYEFRSATSESVPKFLKSLSRKANIGIAFCPRRRRCLPSALPRL